MFNYKLIKYVNLVLFVLFFGNVIVFALEQMPVTLFFNGKKKEIIGLILEEKNAFLPDVVLEKYYGGLIKNNNNIFFDWEINGINFNFELNSTTVTCNGNCFDIKKNIIFINDHLLVPFDFFISSFFENISKTKTYWYSAKKVISIRNDKQIEKLDILLKDGNGKKTIILDAGHGGHDVGAKLKRTSIYEKDINLNVVKYLDALLMKNEKFNTILTRTEDVFIPLDIRTKIATDNSSDLFVSIHANACETKKRSGFEIYFLSETASDKEAEEVASFENSIIDLDENSDFKKKILESILLSLGKNEFINESSELCFFISNKVSKENNIQNRGVKQAGFFVLRGVMCPSVLVELGYMTNRKDLKLLRTKNFQKNMAKIIYNGIIEYFDRQEKWKKE